MSRNEVPIAVIGMACRFPGATSISEFWQLLIDGGTPYRKVFRVQVTSVLMSCLPM